MVARRHGVISTRKADAPPLFIPYRWRINRQVKQRDLVWQCVVQNGCLDHESFAELCPLALLGNAFYPVLVHRLAVLLHASSPQSVTLMQLRFASFAVINLREDFHLQECARAGRT